jgi:hypothetical protein
MQLDVPPYAFQVLGDCVNAGASKVWPMLDSCLIPAIMAEISGITAWMFLFRPILVLHPRGQEQARLGQSGLSSAWQTVAANALNSSVPKSPFLKISWSG